MYLLPIELTKAPRRLLNSVKDCQVPRAALNPNQLAGAARFGGEKADYQPAPSQDSVERSLRSASEQHRGVPGDQVILTVIIAAYLSASWPAGIPSDNSELLMIERRVVQATSWLPSMQCHSRNYHSLKKTTRSRFDVEPPPQTTLTCTGCDSKAESPLMRTPTPTLS